MELVQRKIYGKPRGFNSCTLLHCIVFLQTFPKITSGKDWVVYIRDCHTPVTGKMRDWIYKDMTWYDQSNLEVPQPKCPSNAMLLQARPFERRRRLPFSLLGATPRTWEPLFWYVLLEHLLQCASTKKLAWSKLILNDFPGLRISGVITDWPEDRGTGSILITSNLVLRGLPSFTQH